MGRKSRIDHDPALERAIRALAERGCNGNQIVSSLGAGGVRIGYAAVRDWLSRNGFNALVRKNENRTRDAAPTPHPDLNATPRRSEAQTIAKLEADAAEATESSTLEEIRERHRQIRELVSMALEDVRHALQTKSTEPHPAMRLQKLSAIETTYAKTIVAIEPKSDLEANRLEALGEAARQTLLERARAAVAKAKGEVIE